MEKEKRLDFTGTVIIFFALLFIFAKWGPRIPISISSQVAGQPLIVNGTGKVAVSPDIARVNLGIEENGTNLKLTQDSVNKKSKLLVDKLKQLGISEEDIKTTSYYVYPNYDYNDGSQKIVGYRVSTGYEVKIKNFETVNDVLSTAPEAGANIAGGVSFEVNEETKKQKLNEARKLAVIEAKEKAEGLSKASGINLGKIINISEDSFGGMPGREYALPLAIGGDAEIKSVAQPEIKPGETNISVSVSLSYEIR